MAEAFLDHVEKYRLFDKVIELRSYRASGSPLFFFTMHDNETTAVRAGKSVIADQGGQLLELNHEGTRNVSFQAGGDVYRFDPNRMFSDQGASASLLDASPVDQVPEEIVEAVRQLAEYLVDGYQLQSRSQLYTLHNVTDDLSIRSYREGGEFHQNASRVESGSRGTDEDFFLVTDQATGAKLADRGWNVVVQDNQHVEEDGSLSVHARNMQVPYVNVESRQGHINTQKRMITDLYQVTAEHVQ